MPTYLRGNTILSCALTAVLLGGSGAGAQEQDIETGKVETTETTTATVPDFATLQANLTAVRTAYRTNSKPSMNTSFD